MPRQIYTVELDGMQYDIEGDRPPTEQDVRGLIGQTPISANKYARGERSLVGDIFERPGAAIRSAIMGKGYKQGALYPEEVPKFQDVALDKYYGMVEGQAKEMTPTQAAIHRGIMTVPGLAVSAGGLAADIATNPADILTTILGGKAIKALAPTKVGQAAGRFMTKERMTPVEAAKTTKQIGQKGLSILKQGRDYLYEKVAKPAADIVNKNLKTFPEYTKKLGVKKEAISLLKKHGYDKVANVEQAEELAKQAFSAATSQKSIIYGNRINISDTLVRAKRYYNATKATNPNSPLKGLIERLDAMRPAPKGFFEGMPGGLTEDVARAKGIKIPTLPQYGRVVYGEKFKDMAKEVRITREQLSDIRQQLSNLYKKEGFDKVKAFKLIDSLYSDAEKSGLKGIQNARKLFSEYKQFEEVAKDIAKIEKIDANKILTDLNTIKNDPTKYGPMVDKYSAYVDKATAEKIFKEALSVRRGGKIIKRGAVTSGTLLAGKGLLDIFK